MKPKTENDVRDPAGVRHARGRRAEFLLALAVAAGPLLPLHAVVIDDMCAPVKFQVGGGGMDYLNADLVDCQLVFSGQFPGPTQTNDPLRNYDSVYWPNSLPTVSLLNRTLEVRMDLVQVSGDDVFLVLGVDGPSGGYEVAIDRNELVLAKYHGAGTTTFAWNTVPLINQNVTVVLSLTRTTNSVQLAARIVDRTNHERILYEIPFTDGPGQDPVIPSPPRGLTFFTAPDPGPPLASFSVAWVGVWQYTATSPPPVEVVVDNFEYDVHDAPVLGIKWPSVLLPWSANTAEEQIVVGANSLASNAVWTPWPEPIFKRFGELCMAVPTTSAQQFFKLVPGTQFIDDFSDPKEPFAVRNPWVPGFYVPADATRWDVSTSNGVLRVQALVTPLDPTGRLVIKPPGPYVQVKDFWAAVDILNFDTTRQDAGIGLAARVGGDLGHWPGANNGYIANLWPNWGGANKAVLNLWTGSGTGGQSPVFDFKPGTPYRFIFSGVGRRLSVELIDLELRQRVAALFVTDSTFSQGFVGFFMEVGAAICDMTLDNFFVTGTKP